MTHCLYPSDALNLLDEKCETFERRWGEEERRKLDEEPGFLKSMLGFDGLGCRYMRDKRLLNLARESKSVNPVPHVVTLAAVPLGQNTNIKRAAILSHRGIESYRDFPTFPEFRVHDERNQTKQSALRSRVPPS